MLDLRRLRLLSELGRRGTIAEVARVVGYTPSAISQSLLQLEREAGVPLLEREGRRVRLKTAGGGLVARTARVLAQLVSESYEGVAAVPTGGLESHELLTEQLLLVLPRGDAAPEPVALDSLADAP